MKGNTLDSLKHCYLFSAIEINLKMRFVHLSTAHSDDLSLGASAYTVFQVKQKGIMGSKKAFNLQPAPFETEMKSRERELQPDLCRDQ